ncbi:MAG: DUF1540 domain-containing protein [Ruminococcus sp.]|nr:DUF1540 domain-containing protein [Ruminococcus sp.]
MKQRNSSIQCSVTSCKYNLKTDGYCTLDTIKVGTPEKNPTQCACTECDSFCKE